MQIEETWIPIISQSLEWIKGKMGPSKKDLKIKIDELEEKVNLLSYGNEALLQNTMKIMGIIISQLKESGNYVVNAGTIMQINNESNNILNINIDGTLKKVEETKSNAEFNYSLFDNMDEEILQYRLKGLDEGDEDL